MPAYPRRSSVPSNIYGYNPGAQTSEGLPSIMQNQHHFLLQPTMPGFVEHRPTPSLAIPPAIGGPPSGPHSASPPRTPYYTPRTSPPPYPQIDPAFTFVSCRL